MDPQEINDGKALAALCYPIWIIALVMLFVRNNAFSLYHAKQMMAMTIVHSVIALPLTCLPFCVMPFLAPRNGAPPTAAFPCVLLSIWGVAGLFGLWSLAMIILGLVNAINGQAKPLPFYGAAADKLFGSLQKK